MNRYRLPLALLLVLSIIGGALTLSGKLRVRLADLTEDRLYTLTDGTRHVISSLNRPVTLQLYYSHEVAKNGAEGARFWQNYFLYVRDLLQEYVRLSGGNLRLDIIDPAPYSDAEATAMQAGLQVLSWRGETFIFGLVATSELGKSSTIAFFDPARQLFVEYDLTKMIGDLTRRTQSRIGVISSLPIMGDEVPPHLHQALAMQGQKIRPAWLIIQELQSSYQVETARLAGEQFSENYAYILVVHPKKIPLATLRALDDYVMRGGRLLIFVDPFTLADLSNDTSTAEKISGSNLNALTEKWGVTLPNNEIVIDPTLALRLTLQANRPPEIFPPLLALNAQCVNEKMSATAGLTDLRMLFAGNLLWRAPRGLAASVIIEPLLFSTAQGNVWRADKAQLLNPPPAPQLYAALNPASVGVKNLAVLLRGKIPANFSERVSNKAIVAIIADVDMLSNEIAYSETKFGTQRQGDGSAFLLNLLEFMGGDENLITMRTRGAYLRPLTVLQDLEKAAELATAEKVAALNEKIAAYENELQEILNRPHNREDKNAAPRIDSTAINSAPLLSKEIIDRQRAVEAEIRRHIKDLRQLQQTRRATRQDLETKLTWLNLIAAPLLVFVAMILVWCRRRNNFISEKIRALFTNAKTSKDIF